MKVLIVDDHEVVASGLALLIKDMFSVEYIIQAQDGRTAIKKAIEYTFDLIILDLSLPDGMDGFEVLREMRSIFPDAKIVIFSMHDDISYQKKAYKLGADGYMVKRFNGDELMKYLNLIMSGKKFFEGKLTEEWDEDEDTLTLPITSREKEVFVLTVLGHTQKEIAEKLSISRKTVETHRHNITKKLNIKSKADWIEIAQKYHLLEI
ncbi:response regulator [Alkalihalobacterium chitinilyticum]|uniref:Response regulator transcription factor n=1 Tax=Alkalihalobacterium chitinilyticum TaxID=2980103 RepID=A0ABT5VDB0_9BACI|nr:response regulator transcription factor [Alkalihalobacterium chitinilyticum]MDE5413424.1 response regulator transcription factor [Alkalihalobacterium chitinilyticum]